ncbi:hypothetical protein F4777DRAFT_530838 [Nemania sp. FL0916]|nr:hypothetical protein F4777DRAFT_530838 [Nemania sp. FL0916]
MADNNAPKVQSPLQAMLNEQQKAPGAGDTTHTEQASRAEAQEEAIKDQIDGATAKGPKRADQSTGGRVQVGETGDLHDLAARRKSSVSKPGAGTGKGAGEGGEKCEKDCDCGA